MRSGLDARARPATPGAGALPNFGNRVENKTPVPDPNFPDEPFYANAANFHGLERFQKNRSRGAAFTPLQRGLALPR